MSVLRALSAEERSRVSKVLIGERWHDVGQQGLFLSPDETAVRLHGQHSFDRSVEYVYDAREVRAVALVAVRMS